MPRNKKQKFIFYLVLIFDIFAVAMLVKFFWPANLTFALFQPAGFIAAQEKKVIITAVVLMLIVVVPVLTAAVIIARKYRVDNPTHADYKPEWVGSAKLQFLWWAFPGSIIICLGILTWISSHALDPFKPLNSNVQPLTIEVVALQWKWLFIYPQQNIATVNFIEIPKDTPINFVLTADAPMNSFWIPQLSGQMYAMAGMSTQLHIIANQEGQYNGSAAEINGAGFSGMNFKVNAVSEIDFQNWAKAVQARKNNLDLQSYNNLAEPSRYNPEADYALIDQNLYNEIMQKYMAPNMTGSMGDMNGMNMGGMQ